MNKLNQSLQIRLIIIIFLFALNGMGQNRFSDALLRKTTIARPFLAEMHSSLTKIECGFNKSYSEFDLLGEKSRFDRPMVELHIGTEIPLFFYKKSAETENRDWSFGMRLPISIHVLEDMWGPETAPVINTDYRFGSPRLFAKREFGKGGLIKNLVVSWLPIYHECTHLGDEIVMYRMNQGFPLKRINVSYEFTESQIILNDPGEIEGNNHSFKFGWLYRVSNRGQGWFSARPGIEIDKNLILTNSQFRSEYFFAWEWKRSSGFLASPRCQPVISFEGRWRPRFAYPIQSQLGSVTSVKEVKEQMIFTSNVYVGYRFFPKENRSEAIGLFFHGYSGINPFGQLRNYPRYPFIGLALTFEP